MRRADRLFRIVQRLRRGKVVTAARLAEELEVSVRTVYRDMADLSGSGVPIMGEAGTGYTLASEYDLPPLMFNGAEMEALVLGARMVATWSDPDLARAAREVMSKVEAILPAGLRERFADTALFAPSWPQRSELTLHMAPLRMALNEKRKVELAYEDARGGMTQRVAHPLGLFFWGKVWTLGAWCELRDGFRNFRLDRIHRLELMDEKFEALPGHTLQDYYRAAQEELAAYTEFWNAGSGESHFSE